MACTSEPDGSRGPSPSKKQPTTLEWFTDVASATGLDFIHFNGMSGELYDPETMGPGVALFDYDNDGDLDVFLVQGDMLGSAKTLRQAPTPPTGSLPLTSRLFRNDLETRPDGTRYRISRT
jgi:hypothetical protein